MLTDTKSFLGVLENQSSLRWGYLILMQTWEKMQGPKQTDELIIFQKCLQLWVVS